MNIKQRILDFYKYCVDSSQMFPWICGLTGVRSFSPWTNPNKIHRFSQDSAAGAGSPSAGSFGACAPRAGSNGVNGAGSPSAHFAGEGSTKAAGAGSLKNGSFGATRPGYLKDGSSEATGAGSIRSGSSEATSAGSSGADRAVSPIVTETGTTRAALSGSHGTVGAGFYGSLRADGADSSSAETSGT